ncbi:MAG: hypothetical protein ACOCX5_03545 [Chloroflexota bacterium]
MYRNIVRLLFPSVFAFALLLSGGAIAAQEEFPQPVHAVVAIEGEAFISRFVPPDGYAAETLLTVGAFVSSNDLIEAGPGDRVVIVCADQTVDEISNELRAPNCAPLTGQGVFVWNNVEVYGSVRAAEVVYAVSPRHSTIFDAMPDFELSSPPPSGSTYTIELWNMNEQRVIWEGTGITSEVIPYPLDEPLRATDPATGRPIRYQLVVTTMRDDNAIRNRDPMRPLGFCIIDPRDRPVVDQLQARIDQLELPTGVGPEVRSFNLGALYYGQGLFVDARHALEALLTVPLDEPFPTEAISANSIAGSPSYYILLGSVYYAMRLSNEMELAYRRAEDLATTIDDAASLAIVNEQLADIRRGRLQQVRPNGNARDQEIYERYQAAIDFYTEIGDTVSVDRVLSKLENGLQVSDDANHCTYD